jgi:hypothetical protein
MSYVKHNTGASKKTSAREGRGAQDLERAQFIEQLRQLEQATVEEEEVVSPVPKRGTAGNTKAKRHRAESAQEDDEVASFIRELQVLQSGSGSGSASGSNSNIHFSRDSSIASSIFKVDAEDEAKAKAQTNAANTKPIDLLKQVDISNLLSGLDLSSILGENSSDLIDFINQADIGKNILNKNINDTIELNDKIIARTKYSNSLLKKLKCLIGKRDLSIAEFILLLIFINILKNGAEQQAKEDLTSAIATKFIVWILKRSGDN